MHCRSLLHSAGAAHGEPTPPSPPEQAASATLAESTAEPTSTARIVIVSLGGGCGPEYRIRAHPGEGIMRSRLASFVAIPVTVMGLPVIAAGRAPAPGAGSQPD